MANRLFIVNWEIVYWGIALLRVLSNITHSQFIGEFFIVELFIHSLLAKNEKNRLFKLWDGFLT